MRPGIIELREFYATPRGRAAGRAIRKALHAMRADAPPPPNRAEASLVAFGYAAPFLDPAHIGTQHLMPSGQGLAAWPDEQINRARLANESQWDLPDTSVGAVLIAHGLEHAGDPAALLAEAWRVLQPAGQLWLVVPNRRSLWALADGTPFGRGQPYSATQLRGLLRGAQFVPQAWRRALFLPPVKSPLLLATAPAVEALGAQLFPLSGGAILMRAVKQLYGAVGLAEPERAAGLTLPSLPDLATPLPTARS